MFKRFMLLFILILSIVSCKANNNKVTEKGNQKSTLISPGDKYILQVSVMKEEKNGFSNWWQFKIINKASNEIMLVNNDIFPARFNIYWNWDKDDRLWFYNSDDGNIYYWELINGIWNETKFDKKESKINIPDNFLPEYAK